MDLHDPFDRMSQLLVANQATTFGGACVIVFPEVNGAQLDPIELLILDSKGSLAQFVATLSTRLAMLKDEMEAKERQSPYGR